jgi:IS30 family transposase
MGGNKSTISRELSRNTGKRGYRHTQANRLADERHQKKNKAIKLTDSVKNYISERLKEYWRPFDRLIECCTYDVNLRRIKRSTVAVKNNFVKILSTFALRQNAQWKVL